MARGLAGFGGLGSYPGMCRQHSNSEALLGEVGCWMDHRFQSQKTSCHPNCVVNCVSVGKPLNLSEPVSSPRKWRP